MLSYRELYVIVGHDWMDEDHERLARLIIALQDAVIGNVDREAIAQAACDLVEFTREHFRSEERLMESANYRDLQAHRDDHNALLRHLTLQLVALTLQARPLAESDLLFFRDWFVVHTETFDWPLADFLNSHVSLDCHEVRQIRRAM